MAIRTWLETVLYQHAAILILLNSCGVFLKYAKVEQEKERFCWKGKLLQPLQTLQSLLGTPLNKATLRKEVSGCCRKVGLYEIVGVWRGMVEPINACYSK